MPDTDEVEIWTKRSGGADMFFSLLNLLLIVLTLGLAIIFILIARSTHRYTLTNQRLILRRGFLVSTIDEIELFRVRDIQVRQGLLQRIVGYGTVYLTAQDDDHRELLIEHLPGALQSREDIRTYTLQCRQGNRVTTIVQ